MNDLDVYFVNFFHEIIKDELEENSCSTHKYCLMRVQRHLSGSPVSFNSSAMRCAYMYHIAPCRASVLYNHFYQFLSNNTFVLRRVAIRQTFSICCFCTGLAIDFVVLARLLQKMLPKYCHSQNLIEVDVVIVNSDSSWDTTTKKMLEKLSDDLLQSSMLNVNCRFVCADFAGPLTDDVKAVLCQSDLVTSVNFLSAVCDTDQGSYQRVIVQEVIRFMREGGIFFFLDSPERVSCDSLREILDSCDEPLAEVYGPLNYSIHQMRMLSRKECIKLYFRHYGWRCCRIEETNCVCAWYKRTSEYC